MILLIEIQDFLSQSQVLIQGLNKSELINQIDDLQFQLSHPEVWNDPTKVASLNQKLSRFQVKQNQIKNLESNLENLKVAQELDELDLVEEIFREANKQFEELKQSTYLQGRFDDRDSVLSIHAGAGGVDAQDFAAMLLSMYQAFCKKQGWSCQIVQMSVGDEGGLKSGTVQISGSQVYGLLKEEAGVHRLVRISPFNSGKTRETSFALVELLPDGLEKEIDLKIEEKDLKWEYSMSSGKGGQSVNTTYSAVRLVHLPSGVSVTCQNERSQTQNKQMALHYLKNKLAAMEIVKQKEFVNEIKGQFQSAEWGSQIRSYVLHPYKLVKDHRTGFESTNPLKVLEEGELLPFIWAVKTMDKNHK